MYNPKTFLLIGTVGVGKTTLCREMDPDFEGAVGKGLKMKGMTSWATAEETKPIQLSDGSEVIIQDTPGFGGSKGFPGEWAVKLIQKLQDVRNVAGIIYVYDSTRNDGFGEGLLRLGPLLLDNPWDKLIIAFSKCNLENSFYHDDTAFDD